MKKRYWIAIVVVALALLGASVLFANSPASYDADRSGMIEYPEVWQSIQDYYAGELDRDEALDVFLQYWGQVPVATPLPHSRPKPTPTPYPSPTPTPTATVTPTPVPLGPLQGCRERTSSDLRLYGKRNVSSQVSRHIEVVFVNPEERWWGWDYGLQLQEVTSSSVGPIPRYSFSAYHDGSWTLFQFERNNSGYVNPAIILKTSYFDLDDIPFKTGTGEKNRITFYARTSDDSPPQILVNGKTVPLPLDELFPGPYNRYKTGRYSWLAGSRDLAYEDLCTVNSWSEGG